MGLFTEMMDEASEQSSRIADLEAVNAELLAALKRVRSHCLIRLTGDVEPAVDAAIANAERLG